MLHEMMIHKNILVLNGCQEHQIIYINVLNFCFSFFLFTSFDHRKQKIIQKTTKYFLSQLDF